MPDILNLHRESSHKHAKPVTKAERQQLVVSKMQKMSCSSSNTSRLRARIRGGGEVSEGSLPIVSQNGEQGKHCPTSEDFHKRLPHVRPASFSTALHKHRSKRNGGRLKRRTSRRRNISIQLPSKKAAQRRKSANERAHKAIQKMPTHKLKSVLLQHKLVKNNSRAPDRLLRNIASGVFSQD